MAMQLTTSPESVLTEQASGKSGWRLFVLILLLAISVRLAMLAAIGLPSILEKDESKSIAISLATKGSFADPYTVPTGETAHCNPFYPFLLAIIFRLWGYGLAGNLVRVLLLIAAYSVLYALFPTLALKFGFPRRAGIIAGFAAALVPVKRSAEVFRGWEEPYAAIALALVLLCTLRQWSRPKPTARSSLSLGALWGAAFYISFSLVPVLAGLLVVDVLRNRGMRAIRNALLTTLAAALIILPWAVRNHLEVGTWMMRSNLGMELRYSNHSGAGVSSDALNADPNSWRYHPSHSRAEALRLKQLGEVEYNRRAMSETRAWIRGHKLEFVRLCALRFVYFWAGPLNHSFELLITALYTLLGLFGLSLIKGHVGTPQFLVWVTAFLTYPNMYYLVQYLNRYRVPIDWMMWLSAGLCVHFVLHFVYQRASNPLPAAAASCNALPEECRASCPPTP